MSPDLTSLADRVGLSGRLSALARLVKAGWSRRGPGGFSADLLADASDVLARADQRLMLSSNHTVVSLAGGTGSGKSSLFNRLAGADFSTVGVTRPVTRDAHACVWGVADSGPLLEWLGVPRRYRYARSSALGRGEQSMMGLVLLDLPDHDSVMGHSTDLVDKLVGMSDLMIWVLDPQKYADAAVHRRFLVPLAGHSEVVAVVLNQADLLTPGQIEDCVQDLRRLLDTEGLQDVQVLVTSAKNGDGVEELRKLLIDAVSARKAAAARISADVDKVAARFEPYGDVAIAGAASADGSSHLAAETLGADVEQELSAAFAAAAGVGAIADALRSARQLRAMDYVGWPVSWLIERMTSRDPIRKIRLGKLWAELRGVTAGPSGAQRAEIDNALTKVADEQVPPLPRPWSRTVRAAVKSNADDIPPALGAEIGAALPADAAADGWWRAIGVLQGLLLGCVLVGAAWFVSLLIVGVGGVGSTSSLPKLFTDKFYLGWASAVVMIGLLAGWLTAKVCTRAVNAAVSREIEDFQREIGSRMAVVAHDMVVAPAELELAELEQFRSDLRIATGHGGLR